MFILIGTAMTIGLSRRRVGARERAIMAGVAMLMLSYLAATKHLL